MRSDWKDRVNGDSTTTGDGESMPATGDTATSRDDKELVVEERESASPADEQAETTAETDEQEAFAAMMNGVEANDEAEQSEPAPEDNEGQDIQAADETTSGEHVDGEHPDSTPEQDESDNPREFSAEMILESLNNARNLETDDVLEGGTVSYEQTPREEIESALRSDAEFVDAEPSGADTNGESADLEDEPLVVRELKAEIGGMETKTRKMLAFYQEFGPGTALNAHFAAGGDGDRTRAYAHNRKLRTRGLIEHAGRGRYDYRLRELLREEFDRYVDTETIDEYALHIESKMLDVTTD